MAALSLKISLEGGRVVKTIQFDPTTTVYDACRIIREKILEATGGEPKEYGLFLASEEDNKKGIWLEASRSLEYYMLRNGDVLQYNKKTRNLRVRMLDGTVKTLLVDDSQIVANLMVVICTKIGITNYDEYGLVREEQREEPDPCDKPNYGTLTLRRKHHDRERDAKMDQLRRKLRTDDEVNWVEPAKTLREQGIDVTETLLLRRKLFFSDRNVDSRDPVQLNLLYVQARDAILDGTHPVTQDKACEFAGIQCQIQFGDHKEDKHTPGFLDLKEFLPASYLKVKGIEKKVFREHRRHAGLSELDAKVLYTKSARDLPTYGVAFFLVKEKMKGKNKLVPRLLGVTAESVLRLDERTKEVLQTWPLTTVRRWCASPNTFTLDFGDYSDQYYSVQTTEAEQILQVIAGYIDIIVRKRRAADHLGLQGDEGSAMLEDSVCPSRANIIQHDTFKSGKVSTESVAKPAVHRPGAEGAKSFGVGAVQGAQLTAVGGRAVAAHTSPQATAAQQTSVTSVLTEPQRALLSTITTGRELIIRTREGLATEETLPELGQDAASVRWKQVTMDTNKQVVTGQIAAMNAATAQVVTLTAGPTEEVDHTAVGAAITTITSTLPEVTRGVKLMAALLPETEGPRLLDATRALCSAFCDLLDAAHPDTKEPRQNLLNAASRVGEASTSVLHTISEETEEDKETQDILLSLAKGVANTTAALVLKAKGVAAACRDDAPRQAEVIAAATQCALATSQLVACAKVVAATMQSSACREQIISAARNVSNAVQRLLSVAPEGPAAAQRLPEAAQRVTDELERLLAHCNMDRQPTQVSVTERTVESVMSASQRVTAAVDSADMVRHARLLGQATAHLITDIKTEAERQPSEAQRKLLAAAKLLADATARMVEAARQCASEPQDREAQEALRLAAEEVRYITADYARGQDVAGAQIQRLQDSARQAAASGSQLVSAASAAAPHNANKYSQESFTQECVTLNELVPRLVDAANESEARPSAAHHLDLISAADTFLQTSGRVVSASRGALPTVQHLSSAKHLADCTAGVHTATAHLRSSLSRARASCKGIELDAAVEIIQDLQKDLGELQQDADTGRLRPLPGHTEARAQGALRTATRSAAAATARLVSDTRAPPDSGTCSRDSAALASSLREYTAALGDAAATAYTDPPRIYRMVCSGQQVLTSSLRLVETVRTFLSSSEQVDITTVSSIAKEISQGLEETLEAAPTLAAVERALETTNHTLSILEQHQFPPSDRIYSELQSELNAAAKELNTSSADVVGGVGRADTLSACATHYAESYNRLMAAAMEMAGRTEDRDTQSLMVSSMKSVTVNSSKLLSSAKSVSQDPGSPNGKNQLAAAARAVTDAINHLVDVCTEAAPGQKECAAAIRSIESSRPLLNAPSQPLSELGYFGCLDSIVEQSKGLSVGMSSMAGAVKQAQHEAFGGAVSEVATAVTGLVESTAQAAYLVAVSDSNSVAGRPGLVDQAQFARASSAIEAACQTLCDTDSSQQQVLGAATSIAKHTSALCNACRAASGRSGEPAAKRHFVLAAKDVAHATAALVRRIKALDAAEPARRPENREQCAAATGPLLEAVRQLQQFADSPEFASVPARISPQGYAQQEPILECGRSIISSSCAMLEAAKALALSPQERSQWQLLAAHSKSVSDSIKALVTNIREKSPGQKECANALESVANLMRSLDRAAIQAAARELPPSTGNTLQGYTEQIENSASEMLERLEPLRVAANGEAENLGHCAMQLVPYAEAIVSGAVGSASLLAEPQAQSLLGHGRTVLEATAALLAAARDSAGNHRALKAHAEVDAQTSLTRAALTELAGHVRELGAQRGAVGSLLDQIARATARLTHTRLSLVGGLDDEGTSFVEYQARMMDAAKEIATLATDMTARAATDASRVVEVCRDMCTKYEGLARDAAGAAAATPTEDVAASIRSSVVDLGDAISSATEAAASCQASPTSQARQQVAAAARNVTEKVGGVLGSLQACSRGTQACIDAAAAIAAVVQDLDTAVLFASAGTLHSDIEADTFSDHRENILKTAKTLVEDTKTLVGGAAGTQDQLAAAAQCAVNTIVQLCEVVKRGAASLGSADGAEPQVLLLHAARDVAAALRDLARATTAASGKHHHHPDMQKLKHAAKRLTEHTKRWSLPTHNTLPKQTKRRSLVARTEYNSCDSETDLFQSDQEEELLKLLDYSSQDDDVSPSIFHDNCEESIAYIEQLLKKPPKRIVNEDVNDRYNIACKNSLVDMHWRVLKYGENILLGEIRKLVDLVTDSFDRVDSKRKRDILFRLKANNDLDKEMKRLSQVIEDIDTEVEEEKPQTPETPVEKPKTPETPIDKPKTPKIPVDKPKILTVPVIGKAKTPEVPAKKAKFESKITAPVVKVTKVKPVDLSIQLDANLEASLLDLTPEQAQKGGSPDIMVKPETKSKVASEFWKMFTDDSELWKAIAKRNLAKMEETRRELERFSGHELVLGEFKSEVDKYEKDKATLQSFIDDVDKSKTDKHDWKYNKKYEDIVLKLIEFAKKDFIYKGFDPLIEQLKNLCNVQIERRKKTVNIQDIINIYTQIDISKYTYEELCLLERYYKEIIRKYKKTNKENIVPRDDRSPSLVREVENKSAPPSYHRNVILNINSTENLTKNINSYSNTTLVTGGSLERSKKRQHTSRNNIEIFDLTRTYPMEYYANNWWAIYEDILRSREQQFGSLDNWWRFYETILNKGNTNDEQLRRIRAVVKFRSSRPRSRLEEQLRMLDEVKSHQFREEQEVQQHHDDSVMVTNVTSLLKTVKVVEDEHTRGTRALESTIEAISQEIEVLLSNTPPKGTASPEDLVRCTRQMTAATAGAVAAGSAGADRQHQLTAAANQGRRAVTDLLVTCKAAAWSAESDDVRQRTLEVGAAAAEAYRALLSGVLAAVSGTGDRHAFPDLSRRVALAVADIIAVAETLKGSEWVDPADPTVIAEGELLGAAASIDAAARKLDALRPRKHHPQETDESLNFDEMILEAAKSIIAATSALVRAASAAQRELIDQGKVCGRPSASSDDGQWSEGLVSAARMVAAAAHALVEAANALVQGAASEDRLASAARQVAASTAHLLVACKVKADPNSESTRRLQAAGAEVIRSTDGLVRAARDAIQCDEERSLVLNRRMVGGIAQEIDARSEVLRIEKELEEARGRLTAIRQAKYRLRAADSSAEDTDTDHLYVDSGRVKSPTSSFANTTYSPNSSYTPNHTQNTTNLAQNISTLSQSIHGTPNAYNSQTGDNQSYNQTSYNQTQTSYNTNQTGYNPNQTGYNPNQTGYNLSQTGYNPNQTGYNQSQTGYNQSTNQTIYSHSQTGQTNGYNQYQNEKQYTAQSPTFSSFRPQDDTPKQNYEGFTTRQNTTTNDRTMMNNNYETRLYDTPRPVHEYRKEEQRHYETNQYTKDQRFGYDAPKTAPMSPKFNARELKFDDKQDIYSTINKPSTPKSPFDGVGQTFSEHQVSTEAIPGGTKHSEITVKSESYSSYPKTDYSKSEFRSEVKSPFTTSTPSKLDSFPAFKTTDLVKAATPEFDRISSPYGKEVHSYGGPNFKEETTTEVKEIPNGTQKITTTKIYSSSPVNITSTNTKYEPIKLEGIDELSKSFDNDSKYSTLDSRFNTLESKMSSDTSRSFMRPSEFQTSDYQSSTSVTKTKTPTELVKEIDGIDKKFGKQTISSETIERKSVMTSSHKSETSSTVTKKFGNF